MEYRVVSEQPSEDEMTALEIASAWQRLGAALIDGVIGGLVFVGALVVGISIGGDVGELVIPIAMLAYIVIVLALITNRGQSPGKMVINIKIVKADGTPLGLGSVLVREIIGKFVSSLVIYIGYIWILFDGKRQGWHDKIASTYVVKV